MMKLFACQFPDSTPRIGYQSLGFAFSSGPTKAIGKLCSLTTSYLANGFIGKPQLFNYGFLYVLKVGCTPHFLNYFYHYRGQFGWRGQLSHATNLTINVPAVNNFPDIASIKEYLCQYPIK
jgi:hypothetical protein